jgi:ribosome-binding protein aMBF1 (putative translation factor)
MQTSEMNARVYNCAKHNAQQEEAYHSDLFPVYEDYMERVRNYIRLAGKGQESLAPGVRD